MLETNSRCWRSSLWANVVKQPHWALLLILSAILTVVAVLFGQPVQVNRFDAEPSGIAQSRGSTDDWESGNDSSTLLQWRIRNQTQRHIRSDNVPSYHGWHPRRIEFVDLTPIKALQPGRLELVRHPDFGTLPVLLKIADPHEATVYRLLYGQGVTPSFLGHVTQDDEIIGFITEFVEARETPVVPGTMSKRQACLAALRRIHARGVVHGDAHGENCLLRLGGSAALIDFELSAESWSRGDSDRDLWIMYHTVLD